MNASTSPEDNTLANGYSFCLVALFALNRTVQVWSRLPGTCGPWFLGLFFFGGLGLLSWYGVVNTEMFGQDRLSVLSYCYVCFLWWNIHGVFAALSKGRGIRFHSYQPGLGLFHRLVPKWSDEVSGLASDLIVALGLSVLFKLFGCPILGGWYFAMTVWIVLAYAWQSARNARLRQAIDDASVEADHFSNLQRKR